MWNELLLAAGYTFKSRCRCSGVLKETWRKGTDTIYIYPNKGYFRGRTGRKPFSELENYLS